MPSGIYKRKEGWTNQGSFKKDRAPWNKGIRGICKANSGSFKKGHIPWAKGKEGLEGNKNPMWKGGITKHELGYILIYMPNHPFVLRRVTFANLTLLWKNILDVIFFLKKLSIIKEQSILLVLSRIDKMIELKILSFSLIFLNILNFITPLVILTNPEIRCFSGRGH